MEVYPSRTDDHRASCTPITPFVDPRGVIQPVVDGRIGGCAVITSVPGAVRANHYHRRDWHYCYVLSGRIRYFHRPAGSEIPPTVEEFGPGEVFFSPPMVEHAMLFLEATRFIVLSHLERDHEGYEADVVRVADLTGTLDR